MAHDLRLDRLVCAHRLALAGDKRSCEGRAVTALGLAKLPVQLLETFSRLDKRSLRLRDLLFCLPDFPVAGSCEVLRVQSLFSTLSVRYDGIHPRLTWATTPAMPAALKTATGYGIRSPENELTAFGALRCHSMCENLINWSLRR